MSLLDWIIVVVLFAALNLAGLICKKYIKGVSDFLVAGRGMGRYLGVGSDAMQGCGAITILATWQLYYKGGFAVNWWMLPGVPIALLIAITGWGVYRFRRTRVMTIAELLERRYSRSVRIVAGLLAYISGIVNMGIFPIVGAGFFVYFCGLPEQIHIAGMTIPTVLPIMILLVGTSVAFCFAGGQVTLIVTDFIQNVFVNIMLFAIVIVIYRMFTWQQFVEAYSSAANGPALINPFHFKGASEFNIWFFMIGYFFSFYLIVAWSPATMQIASTRDAHEAKMMKVMSLFKGLGLSLGLILLPLAAFVLMHHPDFLQQAQQVTKAISHVSNEQVRSQMIIPTAARHILPVGMIGAFAAVVLFAFISTHDTYLLAWGSILIQDVIVPLRGKPLSPKAHLWALRLSVLSVAVFIIVFSMLFKQSDNIHMFQAITGAIYTSGAGIVILSALYWRRGTSKGAWAAFIVGGICSITYLVGKTVIDGFPLNGTIAAFFTSLAAVLAFVIVSLIDGRPKFDIDAILHRKEHSGRNKQSSLSLAKWIKQIPLSDKIIYVLLFGYAFVALAVFAIITAYNVRYGMTVKGWFEWWYIYVWIMFFCGVLVLVWFTIGGIMDLIKLFRQLRTEKIDVNDDGYVEQ